MIDLAEGLRTAIEPTRSGLLHWGGKGILAVLDQGLIAGSNFILTILLARWLEPVDYGGYAVVFSAFLLIASSYQAVLLSPYLVLGSTVYAGRRPQYLGAMLRLHLRASVFMSGLMILGALICLAAPAAPSLAGSFAGAAIALPCVLLYWLARSAHYVRLSPENSALGAFCYSAVLVPILFLLRFFDLISAFTGFLAIAIAALVLGAVLLRGLAPDCRRGEGAISLTELWRESWRFGKWELAISLVTWLPANLCYTVSAITLGPGYAGELRALQNIALPLGHTFSACLRLAIPYVCGLYEREGVRALNTAVRGMTIGALLASTGYLGLAILLGDRPMQWLYNGKFLEAAPMIPAILLTPLLWGGVEAIGAGLRAMRYPHGIFFCNAAAAITYILIGYPLGKLFGFSGIVAGLVATNAIAFATAIPIYRRRLRLELQSPAANDTPHRGKSGLVGV